MISRRSILGYVTAALCLAACPPAPVPVGATDGAAPCDPAGVTQARIIRDPATGKALVVHCDGGK